jgi:hypothetical protein
MDSATFFSLRFLDHPVSAATLIESMIVVEVCSFLLPLPHRLVGHLDHHILLFRRIRHVHLCHRRCSRHNRLDRLDRHLPREGHRSLGHLAVLCIPSEGRVIGV